MADDAKIPFVDDLIVLAIKVPGDILEDLPTYATKILEDPTNQKELQKALYQIARDNHAVFSGASSTNSGAVAGQVAGKAAEVLKGPLLEQIAKSGSVVALKDAVGKFAAGAKAKPIGVFLDNASSTIFLIAFGASLVGIATVYEIQTGTPITNAALSLLDNSQVKVLGLKLELGKLRVDYDKGKIELKTFVTKEWKAFSVKLGVSGEVFTNGQQMQNAQGSVQIVVPIPGTAIKLSGTAAVDQNTAGGLALGFNYEKDGMKIDILAETKKIGLPGLGPTAGGLDMSAKASVGADFKMWDLPANISGQAGLNNNEGRGGAAFTGGVFLTITTDPIVKKKRN